MQLTVQGKQLDVGDALRTHVSDHMEDINQKYFGRATDATVTFSREGSTFYKVQISIHVGKNITAQAHSTEKDPYLAFDSAAEKLSKQLRRYKRKIRDHHERVEETNPEDTLEARYYTLSATEEKEEESNNDEPMIIAEMVTNIQTMSVSEAVMRMDLSGQSAILFKNPSNEGLNMVYRRSDGNIGWVDPQASISNKKTA